MIIRFLPFLTLLLLYLLSLPTSSTLAHPMGNFSINHYSKIEAVKNGLKLRYIIDMAEIPTFSEIAEIDTDGDKNTSSQEETVYLSKKVEELKNGLVLKLNDKPLELISDSRNMIFIPGAGGLPTIKMTVEYFARFDEGDLVELNRVFFRDGNYEGRTGWKEIIVLADEDVSLVSSSAPSKDISAELTSYPEDVLSSPPQNVEATFSFSIGDTVAGTASKEASSKELYSESKRMTPKDSFTELISKKELTTQIIFFSLMIAFGLGAFHALSPGHGKTIVAAYLVGSRGTAGHALLLGVIVTLTHTIGVFALGFITLFASKYVLPEKLYPWLGFASGMLIVVIGMIMLRSRYRALYKGEPHDHEHGDSHSHSHEHTHSHHSHHHDHEHHHEMPEKVTFGSLFALGVSGGIIPCPEALIVLLSAISLQRIGFGLVLILAFSVGLAIVLMGIGLLMVYARRFMERFSGGGKIMGSLPLVSSIVIIVLGFVIAIQSLVSGGIV